MSGVRIRHESLRNGTLTVIHPTKRYTVPYACPTCRKVHETKAIHIAIDNDGFGIVSHETLKLLRQSGMPGLSYENEVANPPAQNLSMDPKDQPKEAVPIKEWQYDGKFKHLHVLKNRLLLVKGRPDG